MKKKVKMPSVRPSGRLVCPACGNSEDFVELARNVTVSTLYRQNDDGSFSPVNNDTEIHGEVFLLCSKCGADMTSYHSHFLDLIF
jgi:DNA-directed RNA polymerase subunit M/transcription elongation factor TFIIS